MATAQAKRFAGKWRSTTMDNFDEYMKALGKDLVLMHHRICIYLPINQH